MKSTLDAMAFLERKYFGETYNAEVSALSVGNNEKSLEQKTSIL